MDFEKWHALGNDYVIVERRALPFELTPGPDPRDLRAPHGRRSRTASCCSPSPDEPGFVARLRIFNPDGSEAELSGNGAREAVLYLRRRGWTDGDTFSIQTAAGEIRPTITSPTTCTIDMGRARLRSADYPAGDADGAGELTAAGSCLALPARPGRQPAVRDRGRRRARAVGRSTCRRSDRRSSTTSCFRTGRTSRGAPTLAPGRIRARIFERGVGETAASGTGATGAAVAYVLRGGDSPVTVVLDGGELEVEVGEDLHINLTGWAVPVLPRRRSPTNS